MSNELIVLQPGETYLCELRPGERGIIVSNGKSDVKLDAIESYLLLLELDKHRETLHTWANEFGETGGRTIDAFLDFSKAFEEAKAKKAAGEAP